MGQTDVKDGVQPGAKVDLEAERAKREKAPRHSGQRTPRPAATANTAGLEAKLKDFYGTLVGGMFFVDNDVAEFQAKHVDRLAATQAAWARDNAFVRRFLESLTTGGVAAAAIGETAIVVVGSVMIVQAKRGQLDARYAPAAGFFGIDLPAPTVVPIREDEPPENPYHENGDFTGGPRLGADRAEDAAPE